MKSLVSPNWNNRHLRSTGVFKTHLVVSLALKVARLASASILHTLIRKTKKASRRGRPT